eukprot:1161079-Pelagomonas_calceolata.AAC.8
MKYMTCIYVIGQPLKCRVCPCRGLQALEELEKLEGAEGRGGYEDEYEEGGYEGSAYGGSSFLGRSYGRGSRSSSSNAVTDALLMAQHSLALLAQMLLSRMPCSWCSTHLPFRWHSQFLPHFHCMLTVISLLSVSTILAVSSGGLYSQYKRVMYAACAHIGSFWQGS